jgi:NADH dehydrogenase
VGGGFAGLATLKQLNKTDAEIILIDKKNHHVFQPLLYQVATAALNPAQIAAPLREAVGKRALTTVFMAEVSGVDLQRNEVSIGNAKTPWTYDYLVLAAGAETNYFGNEHWEQHAGGLKNLDQALRIRDKFLLSFERAEMSDDPDEQAKLLTFVIVGGGPTGVELAGALAEISRQTLKCSFRKFSAASARIILIEGSDRLVKTFPEKCSQRAASDLADLGVEIIVKARVKDVGDDFICYSDRNGLDQTISCAQVIWAAGVRASPLAQQLGTALDNSGRVQVAQDLSLPEHENVFVIGDMAATIDEKTQRAVPGVAQAAVQMGTFVGNLIAKELTDCDKKGLERPLRPVFRYRDRGSIATIGKNRAIVSIGERSFAGIFAWLLWAFVHMGYLIGFRNRLLVIIQWVWMYIFDERGVRIIDSEVAENERAIGIPKDPRFEIAETLMIHSSAES